MDFLIHWFALTFSLLAPIGQFLQQYIERWWWLCTDRCRSAGMKLSLFPFAVTIIILILGISVPGVHDNFRHARTAAAPFYECPRWTNRPSWSGLFSLQHQVAFAIFEMLDLSSPMIVFNFLQTFWIVINSITFKIEAMLCLADGFSGIARFWQWGRAHQSIFIFFRGE